MQYEQYYLPIYLHCKLTILHAAAVAAAASAAASA